MLLKKRKPVIYRQMGHYNQSVKICHVSWSLHYLTMTGVPNELNYLEILRDLESIDGVEMAHGLHLWALTIDKNAIAVHLAIGRCMDNVIVFTGQHAGIYFELL